MSDTHDDRLGGWITSAAAYIAYQDEGDPNRTLLLDPVMLRLCGDVRGRRVLDLGCGEGRFSRKLAERGARCAGVDVTRAMCETALGRDAGGNDYVVADGARLPFADASFDLAVSYITLVDIPDFRSAIVECARALKPGGALVAANLGFTSALPEGRMGWVRGDDGKRVHYPIDRYAEERALWLEWRGIRIRNYHRPLAAYMEAYLGAGLVLRDFEEPVPQTDAYRDHPEYEDYYRVPLFTVMRWVRPLRTA